MCTKEKLQWDLKTYQVVMQTLCTSPEAKTATRILIKTGKDIKKMLGKQTKHTYKIKIYIYTLKNLFSVFHKHDFK